MGRRNRSPLDPSLIQYVHSKALQWVPFQQASHEWVLDGSPLQLSTLND
jgi:hypothetical protein